MTDSLYDPHATGKSKRTTWTCAKCGAENSSVRGDCAKCGHEPTAGRRDHEHRRWDESHKETDE